MKIGRYITGFLLCLALTLAGYLAVTQQSFTGGTLTVVIASLALLQVIVQLIFFLHLADEPRPRWKLLVLSSMLGTLLILVVGSLWIMQNLDYNMNPEQSAQYLMNDEGIQR